MIKEADNSFQLLRIFGIGEVPIRYYPRGEGSSSKLRALRDGWRHSRFMLGCWIFNVRGPKHKIKHKRWRRAMKIKQYLLYAFFALGVITLLVPIIAYTCSPESDSITFDPDGGSKSAGNYNITVTWSWEIRSNHPNTNVTITVDPDDARFKRKRTLWPDETIFSVNPVPRNKTVGYNGLWDDNHVRGDTVTLYANNTYYWEADDWSANCSLGWSTTYNGKRGSDVSIY